MSRGAYGRRAHSDWQPSQRQVLDALAEGKSNAEIAVRLGLTVDGVKWHVGELLAQTGCGDRQALAGWWRKQREPRQPGVLLPFLDRPRIAFAGSLLVVMAILGGWLAWGGGGEDDSAQLAEQVGLDEDIVAGGQIQAAEPLFEEFLIELSDPETGASRVDLRDIKTGALLGSVAAGYLPMVLVRKDAAELLVISGYQDATLLQVYDLRDYSLTLKRSVDVSDRLNCTTYCQPTLLSRDQRYLYYGARPPDCQSGRGTSNCAQTTVVSLDLRQAVPSRRSVELQRDCGVPILSSAGERGVMATCTGRYPVEGGWSLVIQPDESPRVADFKAARPQVAYLTGRGTALVIDESGAVLAEHSSVLGRALSASLDYSYVYYLGSMDLGNDRLFIVFGTRQREYGFVVFDLRTMQVETQGQVPGAEYYLPQGESVFVLRPGRIDVLDLATGSLSLLTDSVSDGVEYLLPGR